MRRAVVFPGQGSQKVGMADPWTLHRSGRSVLVEASDTLGRDIVGGCNDERALSTTEFAQPALLTCGIAAFRVLASEAVTDWVAAAGHSLGEFSALVAADVLTLPQALDLVAVRGRAMQRAGEERPGAMSALLGAGADDAEALCDDARGDDVLIVANVNSPGQTVISGGVPAIERAESLAKGRGVRAIRLNVAGAFHSPLMDPAREAIDARLDALEFRAPRFPIAENTTGELVQDPDDLRALLHRHVVSPVLWESCARALASAGAAMFVEAGPGDVLTKLQKRIDPDIHAVAVGAPAEIVRVRRE